MINRSGESLATQGGQGTSREVDDQDERSRPEPGRRKCHDERPWPDASLLPGATLNKIRHFGESRNKDSP